MIISARRLAHGCDESGQAEDHCGRTDFAVALADLDKALSSIEAVVDPDRKRAEIADLEQQVAAPDRGTCPTVRSE